MTLHEESAGGINGRLAHYAHSSASAAKDLVEFYAQLGVSDRSQLNVSSYNYILGALLQVGKQMEAFKFISDLESRIDKSESSLSFPDETSFLILMKGLVEADSSGSLALAVNEIFELMHRKYQFDLNLSAWSLRIRAFLHSKFIFSDPDTSVEPSRVFYREMMNYFSNCSSVNFGIELNNLRVELIVTAVNRRLWNFAEWMIIQ